MSRRLPPLNALLALEAVLRLGSVARAATELGVTPAAVSQQVKLLEAHLGTELIVRHPRGISLTRAGERLLPHLGRALDELEDAVIPLTQPSRPVTLVISTLPSLGRAWLVPLLPELERRFPHLDLVVQTDARLVDFDQSEVALAIRYCKSPERGLTAARLFGESIFPVCAPELALAPSFPARVQDLDEVRLLHDVDATRHGAAFGWDGWLGAEAKSRSRAGLSFSDGALLLDAAEAGLGLALGRSVLVYQRLLAGRLLRPFPVVRPSDRAYFVVSSRRQLRRPAVRELFDWFAAQGPRWAQRFEGDAAVTDLVLESASR